MIGSQKVAGNNNQQAGRDINNISNYFESAKRIPSAIESVLSGLYKIQANEKATFTPPDNRPYTFMEKIEFNGIYEYQEYYDDFMESCGIVESQIKRLVELDPGCEVGIIEHIKSVYRDIRRSNADVTADEIVSKMRKNLEEDLNNCNALLKREEQLAVQYVIFYVFKECKIFNKPPEKQL